VALDGPARQLFVAFDTFMAVDFFFASREELIINVGVCDNLFSDFVY